MSKESLASLNRNTLIGFTDQRGHAWHYQKGLQGGEPNHYPLAVPVEDVKRRLFGWEALPCPITVNVPASIDTATGMDDHGAPIRLVDANLRPASEANEDGQGAHDTAGL